MGDHALGRGGVRHLSGAGLLGAGPLSVRPRRPGPLSAGHRSDPGAGGVGLPRARGAQSLGAQAARRLSGAVPRQAVPWQARLRQARIRGTGVGAHRDHVNAAWPARQRQAQGGVGVQGDREVTGQEVAGARGQQRHGHPRAGQLGGHHPHRPIAPRHQHQVHPGVQGRTGGRVTGVLRRRLQPHGRPPARRQDLGVHAAPQQGQVVELGGVEDDGGASVHGTTGQPQVPPGGQDRLDAANTQGRRSTRRAQQEAAQDVGDPAQAHEPLAGAGGQDHQHPQEGAGPDIGGRAPLRPRQGHQHPRGNGHGHHVRGRVGVALVRDGVGKGRRRSGAAEPHAHRRPHGRRNERGRQRHRQTPHPTLVGHQGGHPDGREDDHRVGDQGDRLVDLARDGPGCQPGWAQVVQPARGARAHQGGPDHEPQAGGHQDVVLQVPAAPTGRGGGTGGVGGRGRGGRGRAHGGSLPDQADTGCRLRRRSVFPL